MCPYHCLGSVLRYATKDESTSVEIDTCECFIDLYLVKSTYYTSLYKYYLLKSIESMNLGRTKESVVNFKPLMSGNKGNGVGDPTGICSYNGIHTRLSECGLRLRCIEIAKDGNCFFMSHNHFISKL